MEKRTPQQVLDAIDAAIDAWGDGDGDVDVDAVVAKIDAEIDAEMETTLRLTREQIEADLRAAGVDVEAEKARALEAHQNAQCVETPAPPPRSRSGDLN
jgi:hypothetical protein